MKKQIKNVFLIQSVNAFIVGILTVVLPLLMEDRGINIVSIGLIYASLPIIFQLTRMGFAILSDFIGRKIFFLLTGIMNVFYTAIYYFASGPLGFLFGKVVEGTKEASIWSVNRPFILEHAKNKRKGLIQMRAIDSVSTALGSLIAGFLIAWLFYPNTIILTLLIGLLIIPFALAMKDKRVKRFDVIKAYKLLDYKRKGKFFKIALVILCLMGLSYGLIAGYVFPLFLKSNGFNVEWIGLLLGFQTLLAGVFTYFCIGKIKLWKLIFYSGIAYSIVLFLLGVSSVLISSILVILFLLFGIVSGAVDAGVEGIFSRVADSESYSIDIGLLFMGFHSARTVSLMLSGFLIASFGFIAPISLSAFIFIGYFILAYRTFRKT